MASSRSDASAARRARRPSPPRPPGGRQHRRERLPGLVVQFARNAATLRFLCGHDSAERLALDAVGEVDGEPPASARRGARRRRRSGRQGDFCLAAHASLPSTPSTVFVEAPSPAASPSTSPTRQREALRRVVCGAGAGAPPHRARAARRDRPGADVDPARPAAARGGERRGPPGGARRLRSRRRDAAGRPPPRGRAAAEGARRLRPRAGARAPGRDVPRAHGHRGRARGTRRRARLPAEVETALYRIVQEALTNVVEARRATTVSIAARQEDGSVTAMIEDDGVGFDPDEPPRGSASSGMRERAELLGGRLASSPARPGTTIVVEVPVRDPRADRRRPRGRPVRPAPAAGAARTTSSASARPATPTAVVRGTARAARRRAPRRGDARQDGHRRRGRDPRVAPEAKHARALDAGRPQLRAAGVRRRRDGYVLKEAADGRARPGRARGRRAAAGTSTRRSAHGSSSPRRRHARGRTRLPLRPRARGAAAAGARAHEPGDREAALRLGADGRDPPGAHHAEAAASTRAELVRHAIANGLLEDED